MPGSDALDSAMDELYSVDPDEFTKRRGALATRARKDGDAAAAQAITALRRPTKAAWILNRLAREDPETARGLAELAVSLHKAQRSLDGARLRELTQQRRKLIDAAARKAFQLSGQRDPSAALRNEVASTLEAALADADTAEQFTAGTLVRSAEWSGFGDSTPTLTAVPPLPDKAGPAKKEARVPGKRTDAKGTDAKGTETKRREAKQAESERAEQRRQERVSAAQDALDGANSELRAAEDAEHERHENVTLLTEQLADARRRLDEARLHTRQLKGRQREAQRRVERLQG